MKVGLSRHGWLPFIVGTCFGFESLTVTSGLKQIALEDRRHKKSRKAFTLRALRTSMMVPVTINQEFWWSWRELNPRPKLLHRRHYMLSQFLHSPVSCEQTRH